MKLIELNKKEIGQIIGGDYSYFFAGVILTTGMFVPFIIRLNRNFKEFVGTFKYRIKELQSITIDGKEYIRKECVESLLHDVAKQCIDKRDSYWGSVNIPRECNQL